MDQAGRESAGFPHAAKAVRLLVALATVVSLAACNSGTLDGREATSLRGEPLFAPAVSAERMARLEADVADAEGELAANASEDGYIWYGRRLGYAGRFQEAIRVYSEGLRRYPSSHRLLRHRGHRYITVRRLDDARRDLSHAWRLVNDRPDAVEPDGQPTPGVEPRSTDKTNILYHLGLAHYLKGDFAEAIEIFGRRRTLGVINDDNLVSSMHWEYMALRRLGRNVDAAKLVSIVGDGMDVRENQSYYLLVRMYAGQLTPEEVERRSSELGAGSASVGVRYGLANWRWYELGQAQAAIEQMRGLLEERRENDWPSFGYIAAEADVARAGR